MSIVKMKADEYSPKISFDKSIAQLNISGRSVQENPEPWYNELWEQLSDAISSKQLSSIRFYLDYFNTASAKQLYRLLQKITSASQSIKIIWAFEADDEDMQEAGEDYQEMLKTKFTFECID